MTCRLPSIYQFWWSGMPLRPRRVNPAHTVNLTVEISGELKNRLVDAATKAGQTLTAYVTLALTNQIRIDNSQPPHPTTNTPPNPLQPVINYLTGTRTLQPCGQTTCNQQPTQLNGHTYCNTCGIQTN